MGIIEEIKNRVSLMDCYERFGYQLGRKSGLFVQCFMHNDKSPSLHLRPSGFHCFGCQRGGSDSIDFYQAFYGIGCREAMRRINEDFALRIAFDDYKPDREAIAARIREKAVKVEQQRKADEARTARFKAYHEAKALVQSFSGPELTDEIISALKVIDDFELWFSQGAG